MRISRTRSLRVNMGGYGEKYEFGASVTLDHTDVGWTDEDWCEHVRDVGATAASEEIEEVVMTILGNTLVGEMREALELKDPDEESFLDYIDDARLKRERSK